MMITTKQIILCADDYGLNETVSQGICQLVTKQRLSAVSCMVQASDFERHAQQLLALNAEVDIGLHLNFSEGRFLSTNKPMPNLSTLLVRSQLRLLTTSFIRQEINAQVDRFLSAFGRPPDFLDGHQHVHHLPVIREVVLGIYQQRLQDHGIYLRSVYPNKVAPPYQLKSKVLMLTGAYKFKQLLQQQAIPHNTDFMGIYNFAADANYRSLFLGFLAQAKSGSLIMCHPGLMDAAAIDPIAQARLNEYNYFSNDIFEQDCRSQQIELVRYRALSGIN